MQLAPLFYRCLQMDLSEALGKSGQDHDTRLRLLEDSKEELTWWNMKMARWNGKTSLTSDSKLVIE